MRSPRDMRTNGFDVGLRGAGDAGDRDVIKKTTRRFENRFNPRVVRHRRDELDQIDAVLSGGSVKLRVFLRRQVDDNQPVDARSGRVFCKRFKSVR